MLLRKLRYLENDNWKYEDIGDSELPAVRTGIKGENASFEISIMILKDFNALLIRIIDFANIRNLTEDKKSLLKDLLNEYNANCLYGKVYFEEDNELAYSYAVPIIDTHIGSESFLRIIYTAANLVDELYPSIMKLVWS